MYVSELSDFLKAVNSRISLNMDFEEGLKVLCYALKAKG
jgi:hypothetical protein